MNDNKLTIHLTTEQRKQIKDSTGKDMTELNLSFAPQGELSESDLGQVQGGGYSIFVTISGVPGESSDASHRDYLATTSFPPGMIRPLK